VVVGGGPDLAKLRRRASVNVSLLGHVPQQTLVDHLQRARGFVFAAEEDFGIAPVEAQSCGTPVIAYGAGGVLETVLPGTTGMFYPEQRAESLLKALVEFEQQQWNPRTIRDHAQQFAPHHFRRQFRHELEVAWNTFQQRSTPPAR
jgi:glycosyltransferase involved in cell wall biosynthesis